MIINLLYTKYIENETKYKTLKFKSTWSAKIRRPKGHYETKVTAPMDGVMQRPVFLHPRSAIRFLSYKRPKNQHKSIKF